MDTKHKGLIYDTQLTKQKTLGINVTENYKTLHYANCQYAECQYYECHGANQNHFSLFS